MQGKNLLLYENYLLQGHHTPRKNDKSIGKVSKKRISRKDKGVNILHLR